MDELVARGHRRRSVFPHRFLCLAKAGPDGYKLAERMVGHAATDRLRELVLYADPSLLDEFPPELFLDDDLVWHQQHFGLPGQIATANVVLDGPVLWSMVHVADIVQRIGRRRDHKTRIETLFSGWPDMLLNAVLALAVEHGICRVMLPTAELARTHTDPKRTVGDELFERVYDRAVLRLFQPERIGDWWAVDIPAHADRVVQPDLRVEPIRLGETICVCHDIEAGLGHVGVDEELVQLADRDWRANVAAMLAAERDAGVRATYNVVGSLLPEVRPEIAAGGHCLAFHSFDHGDGDQLARCRDIDYRLKGYRPPRSRLTSELRVDSLLFHNFEWLASSFWSLGTAEPTLRDGLVRLPVHVDDFPLYDGGIEYAAWQTDVLARIAEHRWTVLSLHDCYAHLWRDGYARFLDRIARLGQLRTLDEVAAAVTLAASQ
jgi:hypothetical protein